jgi:hypothetical protein
LFALSGVVYAELVYDFNDGLQGWSVAGNAAALEHKNGCMVQTFPGTHTEWYPIIQTDANFNADELTELAINTFGYKIPIEGIPCRFIFWRVDDKYGLAYFTLYPGQHTVRMNVASSVVEGEPFEGEIRGIRLDMPFASQVGYKQVADAEIRIDWLALSGRADFEPGDWNTKYVLGNVTEHLAVPIPEQVGEIADLVPNPADSPYKSGGSYIINCLQYSNEIGLNKLNAYLDAAEARNVPVMVQLDVENWLADVPQLWNWWDPSGPGYDPANKENVEWTSWESSDAVKVCWRNWGRQLRVLPMPNYMSPEYRQICHQAYDVYIPVILSWWENLPESRKDIFVGVKIGWESSIGLNSFHYPNGNYYIETWPDDESHDPTYGVNGSNPPAYGVQQIGYAALKTSGLKTSGSITESDLAAVTGMHLEDLAQKANSLGVPREKLFTHSWPFDAGGTNMAAVNQYSCPGWSRYTSSNSSMRSFEPDIDAAINASDAPYWGFSETWYQGYNSAANWELFFRNNLDQRCRFICLYNWDRMRGNSAILDAIKNIQVHPVVEFSIQQAIDNAAEGDTIVIPRGRYCESLLIGDKSLTLVSEDPADWDVVADTVIDAQGQSQLVYINGSLGGGVTLRGITLSGGSSANGGAVYANNSNLTIERCIITGNSAQTNGGGVYLSYCPQVEISNSLLQGNSTIYNGGALYCRQSNLNLLNSTITENNAGAKGGAIRAFDGSDVSIENTVIWANQSGSDAPVAFRDAYLSLNYSNIDSGESGITLEDGAVLDWGLGNIESDPLFTQGDGYFHPASAQGTSEMFAVGVKQPADTSPCIDTGNPGFSPAQEYQDDNNVRINMGCYGGTAHAGRTPEGFGLISDVDNNSIVDLIDYMIFGRYWGSEDGFVPVDFDRNGVLDANDLELFSSGWLLQR